MLEERVSSGGSLKKRKEENEAAVPGLSKEEAAGGSRASRLQTTLLPGYPGPEWVTVTKPSHGWARKGLILLGR